MRRIRLVRPWGDRPRGQVVEVDDIRAAKLIADGVGEDAAEISPRKRTAPKRTKRH